MKRLKRWLRMDIDDRYGNLAGALIGLAFAIAVVLYSAIVGGVS